MKPLFAATPALLLAGAVWALPASAQTMLMPYESRPIAQMPGVPAPHESPQQPMQTTQGSLPQGPYLSDCKDVRMMQDTLTAFCPKGDGTWHTTQLMQADRCAGSVQNAGGDLVCTLPQVGSSTPLQNYSTSAGGTYAPMVAPPAGYGANVITAPPTMPGAYPPAPAPLPGQAYAAPPYNAYGAYPYAAPAPSQDLYISPSATRAAQPYGY